MPEQIQKELKPVTLSIVEYDLSQGEDIFLTYTHGREYGPEIQRTGRGSPFMEHLSPRTPGEVTTDPDGLRLRTWLIQEELRQADLNIVWQRLAPYIGPGIQGEEPSFMASWLSKVSSGATAVRNLWEQVKHAEQHGTPENVLAALSHLIEEVQSQGAPQEVMRVLDLWKRLKHEAACEAPEGFVKRLSDLLKEAEQHGAPPEAIQVLQEYASETLRLTAHDTEFTRAYPQHQIIGQQGCGDLTMNLWNVAYVNSTLTLDDKATLLFLHQEPLTSRTYACCVKWKSQGNARSAVTIEDVRFFANAVTTHEKVWVRRDGRWQPRGDDIEFAVANQQIIRDGHIVDVTRITHQFSDLRHLLQMPNLNPPQSLSDVTGDEGRPRFYFGRVTHDDTWFGEAQLIQDINLQRAAMTGPIFLSRLYEGLGVSVEQVKAAMHLAQYREVMEPRKELKQGEFRFVPEDNTRVEIFFRRNTYGWTMIGLNDANDKIICLACEGNPATRTGHVLEMAAEKLRIAGAYNALLIDEGADVFQQALLGSNQGKTAPTDDERELDITVPLKRTRLRATFIFARPKPERP